MPTNVQQLIQGLAPSANNGNPNTVYNTPASPFANPAQGLPANWTLGNLPSYKPLDWQKLAANAPQPLDNFKGWGLGQPMPNTPPPGNPPPGTPPGGVQTGGNLPPQVGGAGGNLPSHNNGGGDAGGLWKTPNDPRIGTMGSGSGIQFLDPNMQSMFEQSFSAQSGPNTLSKNDFMGMLNADGLNASLPLGSFGQDLHNTALGRKLGIKSDGTVDVGQILDLFIKGNFYMGQTGKYNWANLLPLGVGAILGPMAGMLMGNWMKAQGKQWANYTDQQIDDSLKGKPFAKARAWWRKLVRNSYRMNAENNAAGHNINIGGGGAGGQGVTSIDPFGGMGSLNGAGTNGRSDYYWGTSNTPLTHQEYIDNVQGGNLDRGWFGNAPNPDGNAGLQGFDGTLAGGWGYSTGPNYR